MKPGKLKAQSSKLKKSFKSQAPVRGPGLVDSFRLRPFRAGLSVVKKLAPAEKRFGSQLFWAYESNIVTSSDARVARRVHRRTLDHRGRAGGGRRRPCVQRRAGSRFILCGQPRAAGAGCLPQTTHRQHPAEGMAPAPTRT